MTGEPDVERRSSRRGAVRWRSIRCRGARCCGSLGAVAATSLVAADGTRAIASTRSVPGPVASPTRDANQNAYGPSAKAIAAVLDRRQMWYSVFEAALKRLRATSRKVRGSGRSGGHRLWLIGDSPSRRRCIPGAWNRAGHGAPTCEVIAGFADARKGSSDRGAVGARSFVRLTAMLGSMHARPAWSTSAIPTILPGR